MMEKYFVITIPVPEVAESLVSPPPVDEQTKLASENLIAGAQRMSKLSQRQLEDLSRLLQRFPSLFLKQALALTGTSGDPVVFHVDPAMLRISPNFGLPTPGSSHSNRSITNPHQGNDEALFEFLNLDSPEDGEEFPGPSHDSRELSSISSGLFVTPANNDFSTAGSLQHQKTPVFRLRGNQGQQDENREDLTVGNNIESPFIFNDSWHSELLEAKGKLPEKYHRSLEFMSTYKNPDGSGVFLKRIAEAISGSSDILRSDLEDYAGKQLREWFEYGLWPPENHSQAKSDTCHQLSRDIQDANLVKDAETQKMLHRVGRARLYLLFWEHKKELEGEEMDQEDSGLEGSDEEGLDQRESAREAPEQVARNSVGVRKESRAIDALLEKSIPSWNQLGQCKKDQYRRLFLKDRKIGKRWCELVYYFSPGVLVTCGTKMDRLINKASSNTMHALATFITSCFPDVLATCQMFDHVANTFLGRRTGEKDWWDGHIEIGDGIKRALERIENQTFDNDTGQVISTALEQPSDTQLTGLLPKALREKQDQRTENGS